MMAGNEESTDRLFVQSNTVPRHAVPVVVQTLRHRLQGKLYISSNERLKDEINRPELFIELFDVTVYNDQQQVIRRCETLSVNRQQIIWLFPEDAQQPGE